MLSFSFYNFFLMCWVLEHVLSSDEGNFEQDGKMLLLYP